MARPQGDGRVRRCLTPLPCEEVSLGVFTAEPVEDGALVFLLDSLGDTGEAKGAAEVDHSTNHGRPLGVLGDAIDEGLVDLDNVDWRVGEVTER